jgi:hypothetical protein
MSCQQELMALGKPYPRTCQDCGLLGPCKNSKPVQPHEVLALADWLDGHANGPLAAQRKAAVELRRLHALNEELLSALLMVLDDPDALDGRPRTANYVRAAIAKATGQDATSSAAPLTDI